jgi:hypothetical protein
MRHAQTCTVQQRTAENIAVLILGTLPLIVLLANMTSFKSPTVLPVYEPRINNNRRARVSSLHGRNGITSDSHFPHQQESAFIAVKRSSDPEKVFEELKDSSKQTWIESAENIVGAVRRVASPLTKRLSPKSNDHIQMTELKVDG